MIVYYEERGEKRKNNNKMRERTDMSLNLLSFDTQALFNVSSR